MKTRRFTITVVAILAVLLSFSGSGFAAKGGIQGPPTDGGGGVSPDLGDIIVLYRDEWGLPILTDALCQQPLAAPGVILPDIGDMAGCIPATSTDSCVIPVDPGNCGIVLGYESYTQEVDFGRTSVIRSPVSVIEQSLGEVVSKLSTAQCTTLDPAGRLVNTSEIDDVVLSATIDSPLESLAIYRQLMLTGYLGATAEAIVLPDDNALNMAARGLGAAADKTGKVTVDQVVYSNEIMGLTDENVSTYLPKICMNVREEVSGTTEEVRKCFLNYGMVHPDYENVGDTDYADYEYDRAFNFGALPAPAYIPADDPEDGWFEYLGVLDEGETKVETTFEIIHAEIMSTVFGVDLGFEGGNIGGFTQAADDAREVIEFTHDRPLPLGYDTQVPLCDDPDTDLNYDVSISEESGLQVPKRMVADAEEGREVIVNVANAGPDSATVDVEVVGVDADNAIVFEELVEDVVIDANGYSKSWLFKLGYATTVSWTATATPDCVLCDQDMGNNTVGATTKVMTTGGGGGPK